MGYIKLRDSDTSLFFDEHTGYLKRVAYMDHVVELDSILWRVETVSGADFQYVEPADTTEFSYSQNGHDLVLSWSSETIQVQVNVNMCGPKSNWDISVTVLSEQWKFNKVEFPIIGTITSISGEAAEDYLLLPWQNGLIVKNPIQTLLSKEEEVPFWWGRGVLKYENEYPSQFSYQFSAYYSSSKFGYYFATEDSQVYIKTTGYYYNEQNNGFDYKMTNYPEHMGTQKSYHMPYKFVLNFFGGDWQTATGMYREWATQQKWCQTKLVDKYLPEKLVKTDLWRINHNSFELGKNTQEYFDTAKIIRDKTGANLALHWYGWHMGEHDVDYPDYISQELRDKGWPEQLTAWNEKFTEEGITKIPYINARMWDINTDSWKSENAIAYALKDQQGQLFEEPWLDNKLKPMCPTTNMWQQRVNALSKELMLDTKFDGIYLDQIASFNSTLCFDHTHPHPVGGGTWWNDSYHAMLHLIRKTVGYDKIITTESCCEIYVDLFDVFLTLDTNLQNIAFPEMAGVENCESVPLFNMIYGDYALSYGSLVKFRYSLDVFELNFIRNILWGLLPTVEGIDLAEINSAKADDYFAVMKRGVSFYQEYKDLILYGKLKAIPAYACETREVSWPLKGELHAKQYPKVMAALWTDRDGNEKCVAYNFDASDQVVTIEGYQVSVRAKSFQVVELVETEAATH